MKSHFVVMWIADFDLIDQSTAHKTATTTEIISRILYLVFALTVYTDIFLYCVRKLHIFQWVSSNERASWKRKEHRKKWAEKKCVCV